MSEYYLGVDGGQSSTTALIGDREGHVIGRGHGGPCNHAGAVEGRRRFLSALGDSLAGACQQAGIDAGTVRFASCCLGFSGGPADKEALIREMLVTERLVVTHDALIGLAGATAGEPGILVIAGTGSMAFGRNARNQTARAGGWGYIFGDEGGGFDLARQALRAALRCEEGWGAPTLLHATLLEACGATSANELMHLCYTPDFPRERVAKLAPLVDDASDRGDLVARKILEDGAGELAALARAVRAQLFASGEPAIVAHLGGVFRSRVLLERFRALAEEERWYLVRPPVHGPAAGALLEAYRAAGIACRLSGSPEVEK